MRAAYSALLVTLVVGTGCATAKPAAAPPPAPAPQPAPAPVAPPPAPAPAIHDTVVAPDPEQERRIARLELRLLERDAQVEELQTRLEEGRNEIVRTLSKIPSSASRAEAASAVAEAELALQSLRSNAGAQAPATLQVAKIVQQGSAEFNKQNFGGALYLANQAKALAATFGGRSAATGGPRPRPGETAFALPIRLKASSRANVREGPGTNFPVVFSAEAGSALTGFSYVDEWIRVINDAGRTGWILRTLAVRP